MKKVCYYYRVRAGSAGFCLPEDRALLQMLFSPPKPPTDGQLRGRRCLLYARVDSGKMDSSDALDGQLAHLRHFADAHGVKVVGERKETVCGWDADRPGLQELKRVATEGRIDYILVRGRDRLIRSPNLRLVLEYEHSLLGLGVGILCTDDWPHNPDTRENQ